MAALLRLIRRPDGVSARLSAFKFLAGNAQPSWGSSYTGQNYAMCRALGSKPVVNDGLGTFRALDVGTFRALDVGTSKRLFSTIFGDLKTPQEDGSSGPGENGGSGPRGKGKRMIKIMLDLLLGFIKGTYEKLINNAQHAIVLWVFWYFGKDFKGAYNIETTAECNKLGVEVEKIRGKVGKNREKLRTLKANVKFLTLKVEEFDKKSK